MVSLCIDCVCCVFVFVVLDVNLAVLLNVFLVCRYCFVSFCMLSKTVCVLVVVIVCLFVLCVCAVFYYVCCVIVRVFVCLCCFDLLSVSCGVYVCCGCLVFVVFSV